MKTKSNIMNAHRRNSRANPATESSAHPRTESGMPLHRLLRKLAGSAKRPITLGESRRLRRGLQCLIAKYGDLRISRITPHMIREVLFEPSTAPES